MRSPYRERASWLGDAAPNTQWRSSSRGSRSGDAQNAASRASSRGSRCGETESREGSLPPLASKQRSSLTSNNRVVNEQELEKSLRALEMFHSSQSRRIFGGRKQSISEAAAETGDGGGTAEEKGDGQLENGIAAVVEGFALQGLEIPVRGFDDQDGDGCAADDRLDNMLGSSLVATRFSPTQTVVIPTLPRGRTLVFNCVSTWGDASFVGLAGVEIFDGRGFPVIMKDATRQVTADPHSINVLPEYEDDPRTPDKLFDQVNLTRDDCHVWLAPFSSGRAHTVTVDLERKMDLAMIRVWNYNKSRQHSSRGVRDLEILLDDVPIFVGEIRRAPGVLTSPEEACEHILFTQDDSVLQAVEEHDWLPEHLPVERNDDEDAHSAEEVVSAPAISRPPTGGAIRAPKTGSDGRPMTSSSTGTHHGRGSFCSSITFVLHSTWGDSFYIGLTALEILDASLTPIPLQMGQIDASPRDLNDLEGVEDDPRTLDKLIDDVRCTTDHEHMWIAPFIKDGGTAAIGSAPLFGKGSGAAALYGQDAEASQPRNLIKIDFNGSRKEVAGFHIWNYNKNTQDSARGVREFSVYCDEKYIATFLCRRAPGHVNFDFKQVVLLDQPPGSDSGARRVGVPPLAPSMPSPPRSERRGSAAAATPKRERSSSRDGRRPRSSGRAPSQGRASSPSRALSPLRPGSSAPHQRPLSVEPSRGVQQQYETPLHPCGFVFKLLLLSTWSDVHYIGLDSVELYDISGRVLQPKRVQSSHGSVRNLPGMESDVRTEQNLLQGAPAASGRMWLAPFSRQPANSVELFFEEPTQLSCIHIWNYSKSPSRGVRDIELYVDGLLIYQGVLRQEGTRGSGHGPGEGEAVLFTNVPEIIEREKSFVYLPSMEELVSFFDDSGRVDHSGGRVSARQGPHHERPHTAVMRGR